MEEKKQRCDKLALTEGIELGPVRAAVPNCEWEVLLIHF